MRRAAWLAIGALLGGSLLVQGVLVATAPPMEPLRIDPLLPDAARVLTDDRHADAVRYAPWILHETDPERGRQDVPAAIDFDGDESGDNHWESFPAHEILPTVYYAVLETETHLFLTYHLFHPRDWARVMLGVQDTHEGDGENLQVVVEKRMGEVVLLTTQAHYKGFAYAPPDGPIASGDVEVRAGFEAVGEHPVVFVEAQGHGIHGSLDSRSRARLGDSRTSVIAYRPAGDGEAIAEPQPPYGGTHPYRLVSTAARLWPGVRDGSMTGDGRLFDRVVEYRDDLLTAPVPRYHVGDRYSGPLGSDRGISPFALDFGFRRGDVGALFYNPAKRYPEGLSIAGPWSLSYSDHPFVAQTGS